MLFSEYFERSPQNILAYHLIVEIISVARLKSSNRYLHSDMIAAYDIGLLQAHDILGLRDI